MGQSSSSNSSNSSSTKSISSPSNRFSSIGVSTQTSPLTIASAPAAASGAIAPATSSLPSSETTNSKSILHTEIFQNFTFISYN